MNKIKIISLILFVLMFEGYSHSAEKQDDTFKKAMKYFFENKLEMAEVLLQEEIRTNPENALAYSYLGDINLSKKNYDAAMNLYRKALDINPDSAEDLFRIGQIYYYKKDADTAIKYFKNAYSKSKKIKYSFYHIGLTYLMLERDKQSTIENWEKYLSIAPEDPQYEKIKRAIELLRDPNFDLPGPDSDISIEEALQLGGTTLKETEHKSQETKAGHEDKKTKQKLEDIYRDDAL